MKQIKNMFLVVIRFMSSLKTQVNKVTGPHRKEDIFPDRMLTLKMALPFFSTLHFLCACLMRMVASWLIPRVDFFTREKR